jgi:hypothetical protein
VLALSSDQYRLTPSFSRGLGSSSSFSLSSQELLFGNGEKLSIFIFIPGAFLGEWGTALHFHPRSFSRGMESSSPFSSQELFSGYGEQLSIFICFPGTILGEWRAVLHINFLSMRLIIKTKSSSLFGYPP